MIFVEINTVPKSRNTFRKERFMTDQVDIIFEVTRYSLCVNFQNSMVSNETRALTQGRRKVKMFGGASTNRL